MIRSFLNKQHVYLLFRWRDNSTSNPQRITRSVLTQTLCTQVVLVCVLWLTWLTCWCSFRRPCWHVSPRALLRQQPHHKPAAVFLSSYAIVIFQLTFFGSQNVLGMLLFIYMNVPWRSFVCPMVFQESLLYINTVWAFVCMFWFIERSPDVLLTFVMKVCNIRGPTGECSWLVVLMFP